MTPHAAHHWRALRIAARHDNRLTMTARVLFEDVCDLAERSGVCEKKYESFAGTYDCSRKTIERAVDELVERGYVERVALPSDGRRKGFRPRWPEAEADAANPEPGEGVGQKCRTVPTDTGAEDGQECRTKVSDNPELSDIPVGQIPDNSVPPPGVYTPPEGVSGARAHEGAGPTIEDVLARASTSGVPEDQAREFFFHYEAQGWTTGGEHPRPIANWVAKLMQWKQTQHRYDRKGRGEDRGSVASANAFLAGAGR